MSAGLHEESSALYQTIVENTGTAIMIVADDGTIAYANAEFENSFGYPGPSLEGRLVWEALPDERDREMTRRYHYLRREDPAAAPRTYEATIRDFSGRRRAVLVTVAMIPGTRRSIASLIDISEARAMRECLQARCSLERLISRISTRFINQPSSGIDAAIIESLGAVGQFAGVDRSYIFRISPDGTAMGNTHEWCADGIERQQEFLQGLPTSDFPWWMENLRQSKPLHIPKVSNLPQKASREREILQMQEIQSVLVVPLAFQQSLTGFLGFDSVRSEKRWAAEDMLLLTTFGEIVTGALERKRAEEALEKRTADLAENVRELRCLYSISHLINQSEGPIDALLQGIVDSIPSGWQYPNSTSARITLKSSVYQTANFHKTGRRLASTVIVNGRRAGVVEVYSLPERPLTDEEAVRPEEQYLLTVISERLGRFLEHLQAEEALFESERQFREIAQRSFDLILICDQHGDLTYISPAVKRILGYSPDEMVGTDCKRYVLPSSYAEFQRMKAMITAGSEAKSVQVALLRKDGTSAVMEMNASPIVKGASFLGIQAVGRDVTDRVRMENLKRQAYEQIELNMEQFAVLGDHIRHPLQVIMARADLMGDEEHAGEIREQVRRINGYIKQLDRGWVESRKIRDFLRRNDLR